MGRETPLSGNLNVILLPTSNLCISFVGDDGNAEGLATLSTDLQCSAVAIDALPADKSERSFLIKVPDGKIFYFWCSEQSKLLGIELLEKLRDLLKRKPSLAELSGISESRLDCFAIHLQTYLVGSSVTTTQASTVFSTIPFPTSSFDSPELCQNARSLSASLKPSRSRHYSIPATKTNSLYQGGLSLRSSSFKDGRVVREEFRRHGDDHLPCVDNLSTSSPSTAETSGSSHPEKDKLPEATGTCLFSPSNFLESLGKSADPPFLSPASQVASIGSSLFSPDYCWCPPVASPLQYTVDCLQLPILSTETLSLPPLSSLLSAPRSSFLPVKAPVNLAEVPCLDFPPFLPEPLVRLPLSMTNSQQIPIFIPHMCDPIVHIPFIDVCSSGQGYLVSAGPAISTTIPPLLPNLVNPLIPETDSMMEKGARETLRLLISGSSSQTNPELINVLPSVLNNIDEQRSMLAAGSRSVYAGAADDTAIANSIAAMGCVMKRCFSKCNLVYELEKPGGPDGACLDNDKVEEGKD
ncbi:unnamed protein product [Ilex paraguariensis]|uniref:Uncharacterized protein n=1 Tax=Ilex paraguariensis TaxID=185542 RepID=A0ABC8QSK7_9AQUA